jgi:hypothetical protein
MSETELKEIEADLGHWSTMPGESTIRALLAEVRRLQSERAELRRLAKDVRDWWREHPGFTRDGISTPGMLLLMAVER